MYTQIFKNVFPEVFSPFNYAPGKSRIFGWMVSFRNFWKLFREISVSFAADSKFSKALVEWKGPINYTTFDNGFATKRFINSKYNVLHKKGLKGAKFFIIQISEKIYA